MEQIQFAFKFYQSLTSECVRNANKEASSFTGDFQLNFNLPSSTDRLVSEFTAMLDLTD